MDDYLSVIKLGDHMLSNAPKDEPDFLSAASGTVWHGTRLYSVGDDQAVVAEHNLEWDQVQDALRRGESRNLLGAGLVQRIIPDVLPPSGKERSEAKPDFEALTMVTPAHLARITDIQVRDEAQRRFPHGFLLFAGSGGLTWGGRRRSIGVISTLDEHGHIIGLPTKISLEGLHEHLEQNVVSGDLNIEGICVSDDMVALAQRGNSEGGVSSLIFIHLEDVLRSLFTDLKIDRCEVSASREYRFPELSIKQSDQTYPVRLEFTDIDAVAGDAEDRLVFTAAAEALEGSVKGQIAGSAVGVLRWNGELIGLWPLEDASIKLEGINGDWNPATGTIDVLLVADADDPDVPAPLFAARLPELQ